MNRSKILVVEDDHDIAQLLAITMKKAGFEVALSENGYDALNLIRRHSPDLVILDLMIPQRSGIAVLDTIKARPSRQLPVIMMSGSTETRHRELAESRGADGWLPKPFDIPHFLKTVNGLLPRK